MFATQEPDRCDDYVGDLQRSSTYSGSNSFHGFQYLLFFEWNKPRPFEIFKRSLFTKVEVKDVWLEGNLQPGDRLNCLPVLQSLPGRQFSFFGKIEEGK